MPEHCGVPLVGPDEAERNLDERAFARPVGTHNGKRPPGCEGEAYPVEGFDPPVADGDVMNVYRRVRHHVFPWGGLRGLQSLLSFWGLTSSVGSRLRSAVALSQTRFGFPSSQMVRFCRFGFTVRLWTPTFFRPTPPRFLGEPLRMLVVVCRVLRPVIAHTLAMRDRLLQRHRYCLCQKPRKQTC